MSCNLVRLFTTQPVESKHNLLSFKTCSITHKKNQTNFSNLSVLTSFIAFQYKLKVMQQTHRRTEKPTKYRPNLFHIPCIISFMISKMVMNEKNY